MGFLLLSMSLPLNQEGQKLGDLSLAIGCKVLPEGWGTIGHQ